MPSVFRNVTRTIKNITETTFQTQTTGSDTITFNLLTSDAFYIGFKERFASRYFHFGTLNATTSAVTIKYWDGIAFSPVEDVVDQTLGMTRNGFISWNNKNDWAKVAQTPVNDVELFWIEVTVGTNLDAPTTLQSLTNLFNDETLLQNYYPELVSDTRYIPPGQVDFVPQFIAAKNLVVRRLKADQLIEDESQILDINEVAVAAAYATAHVILISIATEEVNRERAQDALDVMNQELNKVKLSLDFDNSGKIDDREKHLGNIVILRG